jgi:hypothetical protein
MLASELELSGEESSSVDSDDSDYIDAVHNDINVGSACGLREASEQLRSLQFSGHNGAYSAVGSKKAITLNSGGVHCSSDAVTGLGLEHLQVSADIDTVQGALEGLHCIPELSRVSGTTTRVTFARSFSARSAMSSSKYTISRSSAGVSSSPGHVLAEVRAHAFKSCRIGSIIASALALDMYIVSTEVAASTRLLQVRGRKGSARFTNDGPECSAIRYSMQLLSTACFIRGLVYICLPM